MRGINYAEILHTNETKPICDNLEKYIHTYTVGEFCHDQNKTNQLMTSH